MATHYNDDQESIGGVNTEWIDHHMVHYINKTTNIAHNIKQKWKWKLAVLNKICWMRSIIIYKHIYIYIDTQLISGILLINTVI